MHDVIQFLGFTIWKGRMTVEELTSELYLYVAEKDFFRLRLFDGNNASLKTWVTRLAKNRFRALRRKIGPIPCVENGLENYLPDKGLDNQEYITVSIIDLRSAISKISCERYAQVASLMYLEGRDDASICKIMHVKGSAWHCLKKGHVKQLLNIWPHNLMINRKNRLIV